MLCFSCPEAFKLASGFKMIAIPSKNCSSLSSSKSFYISILELDNFIWKEWYPPETVDRLKSRTFSSSMLSICCLLLGLRMICFVLLSYYIWTLASYSWLNLKCMLSFFLSDKNLPCFMVWLLLFSFIIWFSFMSSNSLSSYLFVKRESPTFWDMLMAW